MSQPKKRKVNNCVSEKVNNFSVFCPPLSSDLICDSYNQFVFEVKTFCRKDNLIRYDKLVQFGVDIYPLDIKVKFREEFSHDHFLQRISLFLLDCSAYINDKEMTRLSNEFCELFPLVKAGSLPGGKIRIISSGEIKVIIKALLESSVSKAHVCLKLLSAQSLYNAQYRYKDKYVLLASSLIELFYLKNVRIFKSQNQTLNFGLFLVTPPNKDRDVFLCCGINLATHSQSTASCISEKNGEPEYDTDDDCINISKFSKNSSSSLKQNNQMSEYVNGTSSGLFGIPYYINSVCVNESPSVNIFEFKDAVVMLYDSVESRFTGDSFIVDMTYVKLRFKNSKGKIVHQVGDELFWKYHAYF